MAEHLYQLCIILTDSIITDVVNVFAVIVVVNTIVMITSNTTTWMVIIVNAVHVEGKDCHRTHLAYAGTHINFEILRVTATVCSYTELNPDQHATSIQTMVATVIFWNEVACWSGASPE